ncbi:MAG TPA: DUF1674 domain-containing protein [Alphaproteobacteria bacterium]
MSRLIQIDPPKKPEIPPNESPIPDREDPSRPSIPEELPQPTPDPSPSDNPPVTMSGMAMEYGGRKGPEATRYSDWELNGKCVDF